MATTSDAGQVLDDWPVAQGKTNRRRWAFYDPADEGDPGAIANPDPDSAAEVPWVTPTDLTDATVVMQVRPKYAQADAGNEPVLELTSDPAAGIDIDDNEITATITDEQSAYDAMPRLTSSGYYYEVETELANGEKPPSLSVSGRMVMERETVA